MATIKQLIEQLQDEGNLDQPIMFQYILAEHTSYDEEEFEARLDEVENTNFYDHMSEAFFSALDDVELPEEDE